MKYVLVAMMVLASGSNLLADDGGLFSLPHHFLGDLVATVAFGLVGIGIIVVGYKIFDHMSPCDYDKQIEAGNVAAAMTVGAVILGLCYVVATVISSVIG